MSGSVKIHIDIETYSEEDLKAAGLYRYAEHPSTDLTVVNWAVDDSPVHIWIPWDLPQEYCDKIRQALLIAPEYDGGDIFFGSNCPVELAKALEAAGDAEIAAHNAQFERVVLNGPAGQRHGVPKLRIEQMLCTMAKCAVHGLPQALEHAANALGSHPKQKENASAMRYFAKPRNDKEKTRPTPVDEFEKFIFMVRYCIDDVKAERDLDVNIPDLTEREMEIYRLDQRINERGVKVDLEMIDDAQFLTAEYKKQLEKFCVKMTGLKPSQTGKLGEWVRANGYPTLANLQAPTVKEALDDPACPDTIKKVLRCYTTHTMKAVAKYDAAERAVCSDGRIRGMFQYYGAGPGRWSSRIVQLQNMLRPVIKDVDLAIQAMRERSLNWIRWLWQGVDAMKVFASCTRGMLIAGEGKDLMAFDFAQIESRIQAWLAGATWKLEFFRSKSEFKIYHMTGAQMFGCKPEEVVDKGEDQKYTAAKIGELACGYQGGSAAIEKMARQMGMNLTVDSEWIKALWRAANQDQVQLWYDLEEACRYAIENPGKAYSTAGGKIMFKVVGRWLYMRLPSGRRLAYLDPEMTEEGITYMGIDTYTRKWKRVQTYGGKLLQNACEGIGRDLLVCGLFEMENAGYATIITVHDEAVFEIDKHFGSEEEAVRLMTIPRKWAAGLPVACDGWRAKRYQKK